MDATTIERARSGDRAAQAEVLAHVEKSIASAVSRMRLSEADHADTMQDARIRVIAMLPRFAGKSSITTWAFTVARNVAINRIRSASRRYETPCEIIDDVVTDHAPASDALFDQAFDSGKLRDALVTLSPEMRRAFEAFYVDDRGLTDIARELGCLEPSLRVRMFRARATLRTRLAEVSP